MLGFTIVHERHLSDIPFLRVSSRLIKKISESVVDIPEEVAHLNQGEPRVFYGLTLWRDPIDDSIRLSRTALVPKRSEYSDDFHSHASEASHKASDIAHVYHIKLDDDGDVLIGVSLYCPEHKEQSTYALHHAELRRIGQLMNEYEIPIVHYFFHSDQSVSNNAKVMLITKLALPLFLRGAETGGTEPESGHRQKLESYFELRLREFLKSVVGVGNFYVCKAHII